MSEETAPDIVATLEDDTGERMVEIARAPDGTFTFAELHQDADGDDWREVVQDAQQIFKTEYAAYSAAMRSVEWLMD